MEANDESLIGPLNPTIPVPKAAKKPLTTDNGRNPGPWRMDDRGIINADPREGTVSEAAGAVAFVYSPNNPVGKANGALIAAAPDLLAACELLLTVSGLDREAPHAVEVTRAAIAKAKGGAA